MSTPIPLAFAAREGEGSSAVIEVMPNSNCGWNTIKESLDNRL